MLWTKKKKKNEFSVKQGSGNSKHEECKEKLKLVNS